MAIDIFAMMQHLLPETREEILPLLADSREERVERRDVAKERRDRDTEHRLYRLCCVGNSLVGSLAKISFEKGDYGNAEEVARHGHYFYWAARTAKMQGRMEEARNYFKIYLENGEFYPTPGTLRELREYFSGGGAEAVLLPVAGRWGGDIPMLIKVVIALEKGERDFAEKAYKKSKRELDKFQRRKRPDFEDIEASEEHYIHERTLESEHAELCEVLGRHDESMKFLLSDGLNAHLLLYEPYADLVERREDKQRIYQRIISRGHLFSSPHFAHMALAAEKLGQEERARGYYERALEQEERSFDFAGSFKIAQRLSLTERARAYVDVPTYLYEHKHI